MRDRGQKGKIWHMSWACLDLLFVKNKMSDVRYLFGARLVVPRGPLEGGHWLTYVQLNMISSWIATAG